jgi:hypothetical protein
MKPAKATALALLMTAMVGILLVQSANAASLTPNVYPSSSGANAEYAFLLRYSGAFPASSVDVYIDESPRALGEVDPADTNFTDGKDYALRTKLPEGTHVYYFLVVDSNGTEHRTAAGLVHVEPLLAFGHVDVALAVLIFMLPLLYALFLMRKAARSLERMSKRVDDIERRAGLNPPEPPREEVPPKAG